jgi:hypothetical protein
MQVFFISYARRKFRHKATDGMIAITDGMPSLGASVEINIVVSWGFVKL